MKSYLTEAIGTFFLVLTVGLTVVDGTPMAPFAVGTALMAMIYMGGHISGAHYNPAVSVAFLLRGRFERKELLPYWISQLTGALLACLAVYVVTGQTFALAPADDASALSALVIEVLFTFALALVILQCATATATAGNAFYGVAIGFTVMAGAFVGGPISGAAFNPAVGIVPILTNALIGDGSYGDLWLYLVGPFLGAAAATVAFRIQNPED